ncbi:hypothetical protein Glove_212g163 [Diversispora epigaea]|uniref:Protein kinase domain-containing protein n=1 Tax=Diversispora epigaea TaxID=1348612 RepID=A0A397II13_9GLOM|nr:hypothetical protein Glove_212g163 [Diversispora epigaea]
MPKVYQNVTKNVMIIGNEWISYDRFQDIKQIAKGGYEVVLKKFNNIVDINEEFLNEIAILLRTNVGSISITLYGITKDPETHEYMMVLYYYKGRSLRNHLNNNFDNFDNISWDDKSVYLNNLAIKFAKIHRLDIVHRDFHLRNILKFSLQNNSSMYLSDFGLSELITENIKNSQKSTISGVLPYIVSEVLSEE